MTATVLVGRCRPQEYSRKWPHPGHPSEAANPDNWPFLKDRISRPVVVRLVMYVLKFSSPNLVWSSAGLVDVHLSAEGLALRSPLSETLRGEYCT